MAKGAAFINEKKAYEFINNGHFIDFVFGYDKQTKKKFPKVQGRETEYIETMALNVNDLRIWQHLIVNKFKLFFYPCVCYLYICTNMLEAVQRSYALRRSSQIANKVFACEKKKIRDISIEFRLYHKG